MLFRLLVLAIVIGLGIMSLRRWSKKMAAAALGELSAGEVAELVAQAQASSSKTLTEALRIRAEVHKILADDKAHAETAAELGAQIDRALSQLSRQHTALERIGRALGALDLNALAEAERQASEAVAGAAAPEARAEAQRTLERVQLQRTQLEQLGKRRRELESGGAQIILDLQNLHLALLDAASSREGIGSDAVRALRDRLGEATRDVALATQAEAEISRAMAAERS